MRMGSSRILGYYPGTLSINVGTGTVPAVAVGDRGRVHVDLRHVPRGGSEYDTLGIATDYFEVWARFSVLNSSISPGLNLYTRR